MKCVNHPDYISLCFASPQRALSSAVLNGGLSNVRSLLNLKVDQFARPPFAPPEQTLSDKAQSLALPGATLGMMTAASMKSMRFQQVTRSADYSSADNDSNNKNDDSELCETFTASVWVTCGLSNLLRSGDPADARIAADAIPEPGTINIWLHCSRPLTDSALAEALILLSEAKTSAVHDAGLLSTVSALPATGTGTDSHAVLCPISHSSYSTPLPYAGKHTLLGECIGSAVHGAVTQSIHSCLMAESPTPNSQVN